MPEGGLDDWRVVSGTSRLWVVTGEGKTSPSLHLHWGRELPVRSLQPALPHTHILAADHFQGAKVCGCITMADPPTYCQRDTSKIDTPKMPCKIKPKTSPQNPVTLLPPNKPNAPAAELDILYAQRCP